MDKWPTRRSRNQKGRRVGVGLHRVERLSDEVLGISFGPFPWSSRCRSLSGPLPAPCPQGSAC